MDKRQYLAIENYMLSCMEDSAHDREHIYRVLYQALEIAKAEINVNHDVLIGACLLHDIGRKEQFENPKLCHAMIGAQKAYDFLTSNGFDGDYAERVKQCIQTHRFRKGSLPQSIEAKILFDADKLDAVGTIGIARTLIYKGIVSDPLYSLLPDGTISNGENDSEPSFFQEYKHKLERLYENFYTARASELASERQRSAVDFYNRMYEEVTKSYADGKEALNRILD